MIIREAARKILRALATFRLAREAPTVIAITGSVGKTSTKEAVYTVLNAKFGQRVRKSSGNMNNEEGVPLSILDVREVPTRWRYPGVILKAALGTLFFLPSAERSFLILELAAEKPGDIANLVSLLGRHLKVGVVSTVGPIHLDSGQFASVEEIAAEKAKVVELLPQDAWAVLNKDNPYTRAMANRTRAQVVWFSDKGLDTAVEIAATVGRIFGIKGNLVDRALINWERPYGRLHELNGLKGSRLLDDSYNANPMSMEQALEALARRRGRKIAILGDMLELGADEKIYHQQVGKLAKRVTDMVIGVGSRARWYQPTYWFSTPAEAAHFVRKFVRLGDTILIKGSQSMRMEVVSEALLESSSDLAKLPRQTPVWKKRPFIQP